MIDNTQRTIWNTSLNLAMLLGEEYKANDETTLNIKFNILPEIQSMGVEYPKLKYYCLGIGGSDFITQDAGYNYNKHTPIDGALFNHIPYIMRTTDNDLTMEEQEQYRFRVIETHDDINYYCYYLKLIPSHTMRHDVFKITVNDTDTFGTGTLSIYNLHTPRILNPVPVDRHPGKYSNRNSVYVSKKAEVDFILNGNDLANIKNVLQILYPDDSNKHITEVGICSGIDIPYEDRIEAAIVQVSFFVTVDIDAALTLATTGSLERIFEIGGIEPLLTQ